MPDLSDLIAVDALDLAGPNDNRVLAYARLRIAGTFVVDNLRIIRGPSGVFVAMPSDLRKVPCPTCGRKVRPDGPLCGHCGERLGGPREFVDRFFPTSDAGRRAIEAAVFAAYTEAREARAGFAVRVGALAGRVPS